MPTHRAPNYRWFLLAFVPFVALGCGGTTTVTTEPPVDDRRVEKEIKAFCGACHTVPDPELFPAKYWIREVEQGYGFYAESGRTDLDPPRMHEVVEYFRTRAHSTHEFPKYDKPDSLKIELVPGSLTIPDERVAETPAISSIRFDHSVSPPRVAYTDMRNGKILSGRWKNDRLDVTVIGQAKNPARIVSCDLNQDGARDWLVADLGNFLPAYDHFEGSVSVLLNRGDEYESVTLLDNLSRVADVRASDFDRDGDLDLLVAEFGFRNTGRLLLCTQTGSQNGIPQFSTKVLDNRHGAMETSLVDVNKDGLMDFVCLFAQEHESVELFINQGSASFERNVLYEAIGPSFGSTSIELVDLDQDGDDDLLLTNGDTFDASKLHPYHQVQWLENDGAWKMTHHPITVLPGAYQAQAADLDLDGDIDIVAIALLPDDLIESEEQAQLAGTVLLEQVAPNEFVRHELEATSFDRAAMALGDIDGSGTVDILLGSFLFEESDNRPADLTILLSSPDTDSRSNPP